MESYDSNIYEGMHKVKVTLQCREYVGHITYDMGGNCHGLTIIQSADFESETFEHSENDCKLQYHEKYDYFTAELVSEDGDILLVEGDSTEMNDMIVAVEIIDYSDETN